MNAIYVRQSIDKRDSLSIESQIELCRRFVGSDAKVFSDRGFSGKNTKRPSFGELMGAVERGEVERIVVYRLDRFSRSIADFGRVWEKLEQHGVEFISVTENFDTSTPIGRAMLNIVLVFAQLERETIAERVRDNYIHRFELGAWTGGPAPYGFDLTKIAEDGRLSSSLIRNGCAPTVLRIFRRYSEPDVTLRGLARELNEEGIHGPKRELWDNVTLSRMLRSPLYVRADEGVYWHYRAKGMEIRQELAAFDRLHACNIVGRRVRGGRDSCGRQLLTVANHEGIVDADLWLKVQDKIDGNSQIPRENAGKYSWLSGMMKCAKCGYSVKINRKKREDRLDLVCSGRSNFASCDSSISVDLRQLEQLIGDRIGRMLSENRPEEIPAAQREDAWKILEVERKIERLVMALAESGDAPAKYIKRQIEQLDRQREELLKGRPASVQPQPIDFDRLDFDEKKLVASQLIDRILLSGEEVQIIWKV